MALINRSFNGKLNLDTNPNRIPPPDYIDALNITRDAQGSGQDKVVTNIDGNQVVLYTLPTGTNKRIGSRADSIRNRIYYWVWNSNGYNLWLYYDRNTNTVIKLIEDLTDTDNIPVLDFDPSKKINHVDIIYRDVEGDMVFWTDGNTTPKKANVKNIIDNEYTVIKSAFIELAKMPPLDPPICVYGTDSTRTANALRRKLFQFTQQWKYDDFEFSSFSTFSKVPLPIGYYGSDNDLDNSSNNYITITVQTGDENVTDIIVAARNNIGAAWGDFVLVASLNKADLNIPDNSEYDFLFYNDALYPPITEGAQYLDGVQSIPLFYWVPQLSDGNVLGNGTTPVHGAITEGYDNYPINDLDVTLTAANVNNTPPDADPLAINYVFGGASWTFTVTGTVIEGTNIKMYIFFNGNPSIGQTYGVRLVAEYTTLAGDDINDVAFALYSDFNSYSSVPVITGGYGANIWTSNFGTTGSYVFSVQIIPGTSVGSISTEKTWLWDANYVFGIVYVDEQNRDMPGVTTYSNPIDSNNDFVVTTPSFSLDGTTVQTPVISASVNHLPPDGAVAYYWVRRRQTYGTFMMYETCDFQEEDGFYYLCLGNIDLYKQENSQFIYGTAPITSESRLRIIAGITNDAYDGSIWSEDYQILGTVTRTVTGGVSPEDDRLFVKVQIPLAAPSPVYQNNMLVMVYTPALNPTSEESSVYWEWGEKYDIYELGGVNYHRGGDQDQTASQPATFSWEEGDVYFHQRTMYKNIVGDAPYDTDTVSLMDANYSDFFDSAVNDNGRGQPIEANAKNQFNPTLVRFSGAYQNGTNISRTNVFLFDNFDEYDRGWGAIKKMFVENRSLYILQEFNVGIVPILTQVVLDTAGNPLQANSEQLLNKIMYPYIGRYGIGNVPESFCYGKGRIYGYDNNKGVFWRLSADGQTPLSIVFECNAFFVSQGVAYNNSLNNGYAASGQPYTGNPTVYSAYNEYTNKVVIAFEEINRYDSGGTLTFHQDPVTISFLETRDTSEGFESKYSFHPEGMDCLNNLLVAFKDGQIWTHDSDTYCNFFGTQYSAYIEGVFNDNILEKKSWETLTQISDTIWECPVIYTNVMSRGTQRQESALITRNFTKFEEYPSAAILRDRHSNGGLYNGEFMKGGYMVVRFQKTNASDLVTLSGVSVLIKDSPLTAK